MSRPRSSITCEWFFVEVLGRVCTSFDSSAVFTTYWSIHRFKWLPRFCHVCVDDHAIHCSRSPAHLNPTLDFEITKISGTDKLRAAAAIGQ